MSRSGHHHARRLRARRAPGEWQQRDVARPLDSHAQPALVPRANARHSPRQNLSALLHELRQDVRALVVDEVHLLDAELAHLLLTKILALAPRPASGTARTASPWAAFASRTTVPAARTAVTTTVAAFTPRSSSRRWCLLLFFRHTFHPFTHRPGVAGNKFFVSWSTGVTLLETKKSLRRAELACRRGLLRRCRCRSGSRRAARTPCRALVALQRKFFLALQIFIQTNGLVLDHVVLHA